MIGGAMIGGLPPAGTEIVNSPSVADGGNRSMSRRGAPGEAADAGGAIVADAPGPGTGATGFTERGVPGASAIPRSRSERLAMKPGSSASERLDGSSEANAPDILAYA